MKIFGGIILVLALTVVGGSSRSVSAAACSNVSSFGAVTLSVPELAVTQDRVIWVRMEAASPQSHILVQVNDEECLQIGGHEQQGGQWSWQAHRIDGVVQSTSFGQANGNKLTIIGVTDGVKVDRVVVTGTDCVPQDFGASCQYIQALREDEKPTAIPSPSKEAVGGVVKLSSTPEKMKSQLKLVEYVVDGQIIQRSKSPDPFDTTRIANGKHTIQIVTTLTDGQVIRESTVVEVKNAENIFSPLVRWVRLHSESFLRVGAVIVLAALVVVFARMIRARRLKKRQRRFHGF